MTYLPSLAAQPGLLWRFLGFFQHPFLRCLHACITVLVIAQILSSYGIGFSKGVPDQQVSSMLFLWYHILAGLVVTALGMVLVGTSLWSRGLRYFFPYLWGDVTQLQKDITASLHFKVVAPRPKGLATAVQGLGLGALLLTTFSGLLWFGLWVWASPYASDVREWHKNLSVLLIVYLLGHGGMALLHFILWQRRIRK